MRYDWTKVGEQYVPDQEERNKMLSIIGAINYTKEPTAEVFDFWLPLPHYWEPRLRLPFMQGWAIQAAIKEYRIPRVSHVAIATAGITQDGYGLVGVRGHYSGGRQQVDIWFMDDGMSLTPIVSQVHATKPETEAVNICD